MLVSEVDRPVSGLYRLRLVKSGPWCAVRIWDSAERDEAGDLLEDECFHMLLNGREVDPFRFAERVNCFGELVTQAEYEYLLATGEWARTYAPDSPEAKPNESVDLGKAPPIF